MNNAPENINVLIDESTDNDWKDSFVWTNSASLLPKQKGVYVLLLKLAKEKTVTIGALGDRKLLVGFYLYVGSAKGSGGLAARVGRHFKDDNTKKLHWHIDYLRANMDMLGCWYIAYEDIAINKPTECDIASAIMQNDSNCFTPLVKVGSTDCNCLGHIFYSPSV